MKRQNSTQPRNRLRNACGLLTRWTALLILMVSIHTMVPVGTAALAPSDLLTGITAYRTIQFTQSPRNSIPLLELVDPAAPDRSVLAVHWRLDDSGWFPSWRLEVSSQTDLIPTSGTDRGTIRMGSVQPTTGRTYEVALSYAYATGTLAFSLHDVDEERPVLTYTDRIEPSQVPLRVAHDSMQQIDAYQPIAVRWDTMVGPDSAQAYSSVADSYNDHVWVRVESGSAEEGTFRVVARTAQGEQQIPLGEVTQGKVVYPLPIEQLPLGAAQLSLEYVLHGETAWESRPKVFRVGNVTGRIKSTKLHDDGRAVDLGLALQSAESLEGVQFDLAASWYNVTWDAQRGEYREALHSTYDLSTQNAGTDATGNVLITTQVPVPEHEGLWRVQVALQGTPDVAIQLDDRDFRVSTTTGTILGIEGVPGSMRICSYNILGFEGYPMQPSLTYLGGMDDVRRVNHYTHALRSMECDIIGIQEGHSVEMMKRIAQTWNRNLIAFPSASRFPGGIFTSYPVLETRSFNHAGPGNQSEPFSRFGGAALLDIDGSLTWVVNFHAWPHEEAMRLREAEIIGRHIEQLLAVTPNMFVMGDFNSQVGGPFDRTLRELGLVNVMGLNWIGIQPTVVGGRAAIDHVYVSSNLVEYVQSGRIHSGMGFDTSNPLGSGEWFNSDHLPVVVELIWP